MTRTSLAVPVVLLGVPISTNSCQNGPIPAALCFVRLSLQNSPTQRCADALHFKPITVP